MPIFNSLGSNYKPKHLLHMVFGFDPNAQKNLSMYLLGRYDSKSVTLTYKGREALYLAIKQLDLPKDSLVAVNGYTCYAVYDAVAQAGCTPLYLDIEKNRLNFSAETLKKQLKKSDVKAVIIQNTLGTPCDIAGIELVCNKENIPLIEDLAHSIGMHYLDGREAGTVATAALSFSQDKVVDAVSGGALVNHLSEEPPKFLYKKLNYFKFLKDYYYIFNTYYVRTGYIWGLGIVYNYALRKARFLPKPMDGNPSNVKCPDNWHASLALKQFDDLDDTLQHKKTIAALYRQQLPQSIQMDIPDRSTFTRFPLQVSDPASLIAHLKGKGIYVSDTWYDAPVSPARHLEDTNYQSGSCPNSEMVASKMVNLPTHINMEETDAQKIITEVKAWLSRTEK